MHLRNDTFCFTKQDLPSNAVFPGNPIAPPSNFGSDGDSGDGAEPHNREKRQSKYSLKEKIIDVPMLIKEEVIKDANILRTVTHDQTFDFRYNPGDSPEDWATRHPNTNYTCDLARLIVWKDGGNEFGKFNQDRYQNITVSTKAGKYYGLRSGCEFGVDFPLCGDWTMNN